MMLETYIESGNFKRTPFALDIKNGKISSDELSRILEELDHAISTGRLDSPYIGTKYSGMKKKSAWNQEHLDYLVAEVASAEAFNKAQLKYLLKVSRYVNSAGKRMIKRLLFMLIGLCIIFLLGYITASIRYSQINHSLQKEHTAIQKQVFKLQAEHDKVQKELAAAQEQVFELQTTNDDLQRELTDARKRIADLETKNRKNNKSKAKKEKNTNN